MENERLNKWRPNDWETLDCDKCQCREARCETWCTLYRTYEDAASAMLAARDSWWVKEMELHHDFTALGHTPPQMHFIFSEPEWQSLKQSILEVK